MKAKKQEVSELQSTKEDATKDAKEEVPSAQESNFV